MIDIAHIHPMLVHFPIVLFILAAAIDIAVLFRQGDLAARACLATTGFYSLLFGVGFALLAALFGDIALEQAVAAGFDKAPLEEHEAYAWLTIGVFGVLLALQILARRRGMRLSGGSGWGFVIAVIVGVLVLLVTAYHGGSLVYEVGVNVKSVAP